MVFFSSVFLLLNSCTTQQAESAAKIYVFKSWYGRLMGEDKAIFYRGGWVDTNDPYLGQFKYKSELI